MGYAHSYHEIFWLRAVMGISEALYIPAGLSLIADYHEGKSRSLAVGLHMTGLYMGSALGGFGATMADAFSWRETFHLFGLVGVVYAIVLVLFLYDKKKEKVIPTEKLSDAPATAEVAKPFYKNVAFWILLLYFTAPSLPGWATKNWLPTLFSDTLSLPMSQAGPMATITIAVSS